MNESMEISEAQLAICSQYDIEPFPVLTESKVGVANNVREGIFPINGLRHPPDGEANGWYIWAGEDFSDDPDFFNPLHVEHVSEWNEIIHQYLALPPGWRFLIAPGYEDVWFDESLLDTK
jgi:hypothetical protein